MQRLKKIAVLMTCYNRVKTTLACLDRLYVNAVPSGYVIDVWLVDDGSPDKTGASVATKYPLVKVVNGSGNLFWSRGMRLAWDRAAEQTDYDYYLWLNDDVMLVPNALATLTCDISEIESRRTDASYVLVGQCCSDVNPGKIVYGCYTRGVSFFVPDGAVHQLNDYSMTGNFVLVPREVFRSVGPICNLYSHAFGDEDYRRLMDKAGVPLFCMSSVVGTCPQQPERYFHLKDKNILQRLSLLWHPKGLPLRDSFIYKYRHWGVIHAFLSACHIILMAALGHERTQEVRNA